MTDVVQPRYNAPDESRYGVAVFECTVVVCTVSVHLVDLDHRIHLVALITVPLLFVDRFASFDTCVADLFVHVRVSAVSSPERW